MPELFVKLRQIAKKEPSALSAMYYADTGAPPASKALFGDPRVAKECSEILRAHTADVREMWQRLSESDFRDLGEALRDLGEAFREMSDRPSGDCPKE